MEVKEIYTHYFDTQGVVSRGFVLGFFKNFDQSIV